MKLLNRLRRFWKKRHQPLLCILTGSVLFVFLFGYRILDPTYFEWTMTGDASQHFIGWHFYRFEDWVFPPGAIKTYAYPEGTSVVYTDSIPIVAMLLKPFSPILPPVFQYHGLWLLLCYLLQGVAAWRLLAKVTASTTQIWLGMLFILMSPIIAKRAGHHEALSAHWIILVALCLYFHKDNLGGKIKWAALLAVSSMIHFYLTAMALMIWAAHLLHAIAAGKVAVSRKRRVAELSATAVATLSAIAFCMWMAGYFVIEMGSTALLGFGHYSMNLVSPFNPAPDDRFFLFRPIALAVGGQYEGFNYLGAGALLLCGIGIFLFFRRGSRAHLNRVLPLAGACFLLFVFSLSNKVTAADKVLFEVPLSESLKSMAETLRSSGRMFWPVGYVTIFAAFAAVVKYARFKPAVVVLVLALTVQWVDFSTFFRKVGNLEENPWRSPLQSALWEELAGRYRNIVYLPPIYTKQEPPPFALLAAKYRMTLNVGYVARFNIPKRLAYSRDLTQEFVDKRLRIDSLYVLQGDSLQQFASSVAVNVDGYTIVAPGVDLRYLRSRGAGPPPVRLQNR